MTSRRRTKWKGWIELADVPVELLEKFKQYNARYRHYCKTLSTPSNGTENHWEAHQMAGNDVHLTPAEKDIRSRITPYNWDAG